MIDKNFKKYTIAAYCAVFVMYVVNFISCSQSALPGFSYYFTNSDMHANLKWAESILMQGPLNPIPHHPYNDWMQSIAPFDTWNAWWGNSAIYQQSPLYTYLLALFFMFSQNILFVHFFQMLAGFMLCLSTGVLTREVTNKKTGLIAFIIAGLYAPFYAYSWPLLRDLLGWLLISTSSVFIIRWWRIWEDDNRPSAMIATTLGFILALGLLARETFYVIICVVIVAGGIKAVRNSRYMPVTYMLLAILVTVSPLIYRNVTTGAPFFSTSNRFSETFIEFNAPSSSGTDFMVPFEMKQILEKSNGAPIAVIKETMSLYENNYFLWFAKTARKITSLLDPYESPDNVNIYYMKLISPVVRYGLPHWLIIIPGLYGVILSLVRRDMRHCWLWVLFICLCANVIVFGPTSRYRQVLCIFWIPWAAYFIDFLQSQLQQKRFLNIVFLPMGWALCLFIEHQSPDREMYRPSEFYIASQIYWSKGEGRKGQAQIELYKKLTSAVQ